MFQHTARKVGGVIISTDLDGNSHEQDTMQCCHCNNHWVVQPGSGTIRGFCTLCNARHCGSPGCMECLPFEKRMDMYEKGLIKFL